MGAGFLFWVVAARTASVPDVGIAAASVSAVMLCTQLGLLGSGSAVIVEIGRDSDASPVLDTAFTLLTLASSGVAAIYLAASASIGTELGTVAAASGFVVIFLLTSVLGTAVICLDQASVALGHASSSTLRYAVGGAAALAALVAATLRPGDLRAIDMFACWSIGAAGACLVGALQLRLWIGYRYRPTLHFRRSRRMLRIGVLNQLLTLTERVPALIVPVLVAHTVAPEATAFWYPAWMMAWIAYTAPISVGVVQFAEAVRHPHALHRTTWSGVQWSLLLGGGMAVVLALAAEPLLGLMGAAYAAASADALRILALGIVPYALLQAYNAVCRGLGAFAEGIGTGLVLAVIVCVATVLMADGGATAMAVAWIGTFVAGAGWAFVRLRSMAAMPAVDSAVVGHNDG